MNIIPLKELKDNIEAYYESGQSNYDKINAKVYSRDFLRNAFEIVAEGGNSKYKLLVPCECQYSVLFRGQGCAYPTCRPILYRDGISELDIFIERMKLAALMELLDTHPIVKKVYFKEHYKVNYEGLAQHYGIKTAMLDFTSDIDVALFFAMCNYNKTQKKYEAVQSDDNVGVIYCISPIRIALDNFKNQNLFSNKIEVIGLQVFERPAMQRGFALRMGEKEDLHAWECHFSYSKADSEEYLKRFGDGLWCNDILVDKVEEINAMTAFTPNHFRKAYELSGFLNCSKGKIRKLLAEKQIHIKSNASYPIFTSVEISDLPKIRNYHPIHD